MRKTTLILVAVSASLLAGCGSSGLLSRERPDEFLVQRQAPLIVPPDFALTPPAPGAPRPDDRNVQQQTMEALFGGPQARSQVESNALSRAGIAAPGIRSAVGDPRTNTVAKGELTREIVAAPQGDGREAQTQIGS